MVSIIIALGCPSHFSQIFVLFSWLPSDLGAISPFNVLSLN